MITNTVKGLSSYLAWHSPLDLYSFALFSKLKTQLLMPHSLHITTTTHTVHRHDTQVPYASHFTVFVREKTTQMYDTEEMSGKHKQCFRLPNFHLSTFDSTFWWHVEGGFLFKILLILLLVISRLRACLAGGISINKSQDLI